MIDLNGNTRRLSVCLGVPVFLSKRSSCAIELQEFFFSFGVFFLSVYLSTYLPIHPSIHPPTPTDLFTIYPPPIHPSIPPSLHPSTPIIHPSTHHLSIHPSIQTCPELLKTNQEDVFDSIVHTF